jgi:hypothetical protein
MVMGDAPDDVEGALRTILGRLDADKMDAQRRASIEQKCQAIHSMFGGTGPEAIYPPENE